MFLSKKILLIIYITESKATTIFPEKQKKLNYDM